MKEEFTTKARRWYDQDPVLSSAMETLEESGDDTQIKIALNLIKIITEHNIEDSKYEEVSDIINATEVDLATQKRNRWYDLDETVRTAISMLQNCPEDTRHAIAVEMAKMVVEEIKKNEEDEEDELDEVEKRLEAEEDK